MQKESVPARVSGARGEIRAEQYLTSLGFRVLSHNFSGCGGEIDLIAMDGNTLVFVEVKTRTGSSVAAREFVTPAKQRRICRTALYYMQRYGYMNRQARFDVVEIQDGRLTHIPNAFPYRGSAF